MKITGNEPAMPVVAEEITSGYADHPASMMNIQSHGLTIRQLFAMTQMQALAGLGDYGYSDACGDAAEAVRRADALIAELNKEAT